MALLSLKPRRLPFSTTICPQVFFLHPGYPDGHNILFILPALDDGGIHHETARVACAILANSQWDGFLSTTKDGEAIPEGRDDVLLGKQYYFRIQDNNQYPIIPSFDNFICPAILPDSWGTDSPVISPDTTDDVRKRDQTCRVTASLLPNEIAHILPQAQSEWWQRNSMFAYTANPDLSSDTRCADNAILLRRDLHKMWDDHRFAIIPKAGKWVMHVLWKSPSDELETKYHNLELQPLCGVARHFLFCRFALAILSKSIFLNQSVSRKLITLDSDGIPQVRSISANEYRSLFPPTGRANSRSQSPKRRQRSVQDNDEADVDADESDESDDTLSGSEEETKRGRQRKRAWSSAEPVDYRPLLEECLDMTKPEVKKRRRLHTPPRSATRNAS